MSAIFERHDGCTTLISDAGRLRYESEQRIDRALGMHTAILIGSGGGLVITFAVLVIKQILESLA